jgi:sn-glycerol 3-phosphate transport system substrate-binding protein
MARFGLSSWRILMKFTRLAAALAAASLVLVYSATAAAVTEIQWWHAMTGANNDRVNNLAKRFNESQSEYKVNAVYKGSYPEAMAAAIAAYRAGNAPHILQVFEVGTATMMAAKGAIKPVSEVMSEAGEKFDPKAYVPAVAGYYTNPKGQMLSLPFNSSTTVFWYNRDAFEKAGLDPNRAPKTWPEVVAAMAKLKASGHACPFTTGWQVWTQLESFSAWHNVAYLTKDNGFAGPDAQLVFNGPLQIRHITNLKDWLDKGYFVYGGRKNEPEAKFYSGECAMMTTSSAAYGTIKQNAKFKFAESALPYYADVQGAPQNTIIGGASLWIMGGKKRDEYKGVAKFLTFLSQPEIQAQFSEETGYVPITIAAFELVTKQGFYDKNPGTDVAVQQLIVKTTNNSRGVRAGNMSQIRDAIDEELEAVWSGKKSPKRGLDDAVKRGNEIIERFNKANRG